MESSDMFVSVGQYLGMRLHDMKLEYYFTTKVEQRVTIFEELEKVIGLHKIKCCNSLNAGYAADGYARVKGFSVLVLSHMVGGIGAINAVAGAYSDNLPLLIVTNTPAKKDSNKTLPYSIGNNNNDEFQCHTYKPVVGHIFTITCLEQAPAIINSAIASCIASKKPVYLEIPSDIITDKVRKPNPFSFPKLIEESDPCSLQDSVQLAVRVITEASKPVLVGGVHLRNNKARESFKNLAESLGAAVAMMPDAKSLFSESSPLYIGIKLVILS